MLKRVLQVLQLISNVVFVLEKHASGHAFHTFFPGASHKTILDILQEIAMNVCDRGQHFFLYFFL